MFKSHAMLGNRSKALLAQAKDQKRASPKDNIELELWPEKQAAIVDRLDLMKDALQSGLIAA